MPNLSAMTRPGPSGAARPDPPDQRRFRDALGTFATGVTIVSTRSGEQVHGMTANGFMSVSLDPALVVVSVATKARMHDLLLQAGRYGVSVLARDQEQVSRHFAGRPQQGTEIELREIEGVPLVDRALTHVVAGLVDAHRAGDHTLHRGGAALRASSGRAADLPLRRIPQPDGISDRSDAVRGVGRRASHLGVTARPP